MRISNTYWTGPRDLPSAIFFEFLLRVNSFFSVLLQHTEHFLNHIIFSLVILYQVFFPKDVEVSIGDVRVNGEIVPQGERGDHVEAIPRGMDPNSTKSRRIKFKGLSKGFSKEVKLRRPSAQAKK